MLTAYSVVNRLYYGMFYFIKTEIFSHDLGRAINKAFDMRQRGDYREHVILTRELVAPLLDQAREFIDAVRNHLKEAGLI